MAATERRCRVCSCTDLQACPGGCSWVGADLCSSCATAAGPSADNTMAVVVRQRLMIAGSTIKLSRTEAVVMQVLVAAPDRLIDIDTLHTAMYPGSKPPSRSPTSCRCWCRACAASSLPLATSTSSRPSACAATAS